MFAHLKHISMISAILPVSVEKIIKNSSQFPQSANSNQHGKDVILLTLQIQPCAIIKLTEATESYSVKCCANSLIITWTRACFSMQHNILFSDSVSFILCKMIAEYIHSKAICLQGSYIIFQPPL